jgi:hypothetical protein
LEAGLPIDLNLYLDPIDRAAEWIFYSNPTDDELGFLPPNCNEESQPHSWQVAVHGRYSRSLDGPVWCAGFWFGVGHIIGSEGGGFRLQASGLIP